MQQENKYFSISKLLLSFLIGSFLFYACETKDSNRFEYSGGTLILALDNEPTIYAPQNVYDFYSATLLDQIYQGLVSLHPKTLELEPCIAKSWIISPDGKSIEFEIRDDVFFHSHPKLGNHLQLTVEDIIFSIEHACTPVNNQETVAYASIYKGTLKGAEEFFEGKADHISGLSVSGNKIQMELTEKRPNFINKLAVINAAILSKKAVQKNLENELIGTGPFVYDGSYEIDGLSHIKLARNEAYYEKDENGFSLPYLDSIYFIVDEKKLHQLEMFENGETHLIDGLPPSRITTMLGEGQIEKFNGTPPKYLLVRIPVLGTQYYHFNLLKPEFQDKRVRQAINYAIDREAIVEKVLNNQAYSAGTGGIVPPAAFNGYDANQVKKKSYSYQPEKARQLFAQAGYPNGEGFPSIELKFNIGTTHSAVADEISNQLKKTLNINMNIDGVVFKELMESREILDGDIFRTSWYADYYSPESFLLNAYGKLVPKDEQEPSAYNNSRYQNDKFDELFEKGRASSSILDRYKYFMEAERILMDDAPFIILWYDETIKIVNSKVRNLELNELNLYFFKNTYLKEWTKEEWERRAEQ